MTMEALNWLFGISMIVTLVGLAWYLYGAIFGEGFFCPSCRAFVKMYWPAITLIVAGFVGLIASMLIRALG